MNRMNIVFWRAALCFLGCAALLRLSYGPPGVTDYHIVKSYTVTCVALTLIALIAWGLRSHKSLLMEVISSALIAFVLSAGIIFVSGRYGDVGGMPWQYFYKDDAIAVFRFAAPGILATLTGLLCLLREHTV